MLFVKAGLKSSLNSVERFCLEFKFFWQEFRFNV